MQHIAVMFQTSTRINNGDGTSSYEPRFEKAIMVESTMLRYETNDGRVQYDEMALIVKEDGNFQWVGLGQVSLVNAQRWFPANFPPVPMKKEA